MDTATSSSSLHSDAYFTVNGLSLLSVVIASKHLSLQFDSYGDLSRLPVPFTQALLSLIASIETCYASTYPEVEPSLAISSTGNVTVNFKSACAKSFVDFEKPIVLKSYLDDKSANGYVARIKALDVEMTPKESKPKSFFPVDFTPAKVRGGDDYTDEEADTLKDKLAASVMAAIKQSGYAKICVDASSFVKRAAYQERVVNPIVFELRQNKWVATVKVESTIDSDGDPRYVSYLIVTKK